MKAKMFHILHMHAPHSPRKLPAPPIQHHVIERLSFRSTSTYVCSMCQENIGFKQKYTAAPTCQVFFGCLCTLYRNSKDFSVYCLFFSFFSALLIRFAVWRDRFGLATSIKLRQSSFSFHAYCLVRIHMNIQAPRRSLSTSRST